MFIESMPTPFLKKLAEKHHISLSKVEGIWDKAKSIVSKKYNQSSGSYWPLVVSITKKLVGESKSSYLRVKTSIYDFLKTSEESEKGIIKDELHHMVIRNRFSSK